MDFNAKAQELLVKIANSIQDRMEDKSKLPSIYFSSNEIDITEDFLKSIVAEAIVKVDGLIESINLFLKSSKFLE